MSEECNSHQTHSNVMGVEATSGTSELGREGHGFKEAQLAPDALHEHHQLLHTLVSTRCDRPADLSDASGARWLAMGVRKHGHVAPLLSHC